MGNQFINEPSVPKVCVNLNYASFFCWVLLYGLLSFQGFKNIGAEKHRNSIRLCAKQRNAKSFCENMCLIFKKYREILKIIINKRLKQLQM
jgi:hypothetical protein